MKKSRRQLGGGWRAGPGAVEFFEFFSFFFRENVCRWGALVVAVTLWPGVANAQTNYVVLQPFGTDRLTGSHCVAELFEGSDGALYGTADTVFRLNKDGRDARTLHTFGASTGDGMSPMAGLVELSDGALYGTTVYGGAASGLGYGTVFKLNKDGSGYAIVHRFGLVANDGQYAAGGLTPVGEVLYGTTSDGGSAGLGTVFKVNGDGSGYAVVRSFRGGTNDLARPRRSLVKGSDGALYGVATYGINTFAGAVYKINPDGGGYTVLRNFSETGGDASGPWGLLEGSDGMLYGTSGDGGSAAYGALFKLSKTGTGYQVLHSFLHNGTDGIQPKALVEAADGALYGTTPAGGLYEGGTIFKVNKDGSGYAIVRHFRNGSEAGWEPFAGLVLGSDGVFYGTTYYSVGDGLGPGVVFALSAQRRCWFADLAVGTGGISSLEARGAAGSRIRLQARANLTTSAWTNVATNTASAMGWASFANLPTNPPQRFYRLVSP